MASARKHLKKKLSAEKVDKNVYDFDEDEKKELCGSEDEVGEGKSSWLWLRLVRISGGYLAKAN